MEETKRNKLRTVWGYCFGTTNHATATATVVIAIVTTVYAVVSGLELKAMNRANEINADNLYQIQRPFILATRVEMAITSDTNGIESADVNPVIFNAGNTPPKTLKAFVNYYTPLEPMPPDYGFPDLDNVVAAASGGSPKDYVRTIPKTVSISTLNEFRNKTRYFYIYGHIEYDDTFEDTPHHTTLYCFELANIQGDPKATMTFGWPSCNKHNCADDGCKKTG